MITTAVSRHLWAFRVWRWPAFKVQAQKRKRVFVLTKGFAIWSAMTPWTKGELIQVFRLFSSNRTPCFFSFNWKPNASLWFIFRPSAVKPGRPYAWSHVRVIIIGVQDNPPGWLADPPPLTLTWCDHVTGNTLSHDGVKWWMAGGARLLRWRNVLVSLGASVQHLILACIHGWCAYKFLFLGGPLYPKQHQYHHLSFCYTL